ncbi:uncharacterized protein LOC131025283 [Salvia miltiorrhiza]|uniref:uncharacterized protein LOC131025283 n=1 Tax=Salvia miltiorrhiza TaxID=226208 RepID=UPI0025ACB004|nr:uncharacterized protein LOC131025283 [Salvia miltiorrhiza]
MVVFKDIVVKGQDYLLILSDDEQETEMGMHLRVFPALIGHYVKPWPKLLNSLYQSEWTSEISLNKASKAHTLHPARPWQSKESNFLLTLRRRIIDKDAKWGRVTSFRGEFHFFEGYWEWTEDILSRCGNELRVVGIYDAVYASLFTYDCQPEMVKAFCEAWCPETNTILTSSGEMSISLWDLQYLSGLPCTGTLYDEVVPCAKEILGKDQFGNPFIPLSCRYLLSAYYSLKHRDGEDPKSSVSIDEWIKFWSKKASKYSHPPARRAKKSQRPKSTHNPSGSFEAHQPWSSEERAPFIELDASDKYHTTMYLAAHIACWLCIFVFPDGDAMSIRPTSFKMASLMACKQKVALTAPVLASIYKGLNTISSSMEPSLVLVTLPFHFIYGWIALYFNTHIPLPRSLGVAKMTLYSGEGAAKYYLPVACRERIQSYNSIRWNCTTFTKEDDIFYVDGENTREIEQCFFMAIRSSFLVRRLDDHFIVESYGPHRFSRQFSYYQIVPSSLTQNIRRTSLEEGLNLWRMCLLHRSRSRACFPRSSLNMKIHYSVDYKTWWDRTYRFSFEDKISSPAHITFKGKDQEEAINSKDGKRKVVSTTLIADSGSSNSERNWKKKRIAGSSKPAEGHIEEEQTLVDADVNKTLKEVFGNNLEKGSPIDCVSIESNKSNEIPCLAKQSRPRPMPSCGAPSEFNATRMIDDELKSCCRIIWGKLRDKVERTKVEFLSALEDEIRSGISRMKIICGLDLSNLEDSIDELFSKATAFDKVRSASHEINEGHTLKVREVKVCLQEKFAKEKKDAANCDALKADLDELEKRKKELLVSLEQRSLILKTTRGEIKVLKEDMAKLEEASRNDEVLKNLEALKLSLESMQQILRDQDPFA